VLKNPQLAEEDKILATPTLAKILPPPVRRIIGDLSDRERVLIGLDLLYEELSDETYGFEEEGTDLSNGLTDGLTDGPQDPEPISSGGSVVGGAGDSPHL
jgi:hypothetical protein